MSYTIQHEERRQGERWLVFDAIGHCRAYCATEQEAKDVVAEAEAIDRGEHNILLASQDPDINLYKKDDDV